MKKTGRLCMAAACLLLLLCTGAGSVPAGEAEEAAAPAEGGVLTICCMDGTFRELMRLYRPDYEEDEEGNAFIGETAVRWVILSPEEGRYQDWLDAQLPVNGLQTADDRIDLFLLGAADVGKYAASACTLDLTEDLGIEAAAFADQFPFAAALGTDGSGRRKASAVWFEPGLLCYRREAAEELLGSGEPEAAAAAVRDIAALKDTAVLAEEKHMALFPSAGVLFPYYTAVSGTGTSGPENTLSGNHIPDSMKEWTDLLADFEKKGLFGEDAVFDAVPEESPAFDEEDGESGTLGMCRGPALCVTDAAWIACAGGTDNPALAADIIRGMTCDGEMLRAIAGGSGYFTNTVSGMEETAAGFSSTVYGGQNTRALMLETAVELAESPEDRVPCDRILTERFRDSMQDYIEGKISFEEAERRFYGSEDRF